ncbi:MAG: hypothetical protein ACRD3H_07615 [Terriglobales bacterium]
MAGLAQDLRYALRLLRKAPGFSLTVMLLLSSGIALSPTFAVRLKFLGNPAPDAAEVPLNQ